MADSILRLRVESQEYDNKLKRAAEGLQRYADECRKVGGTLEHLDDGVLEFAKSLGNMETVGRSARASLGELTKVFTDMSVQYNKLTDEEKASPFGKALSESLNQLKVRIQEGNNELKTISGSINDTGGFLTTLKDKFTINIDALKLFNVGLSAAKAALDVAKDAFFASEANVDEWGRTMQSAQGLYEGFLNALNTGDISGYLSRMDEIVKAARQAYNAIDTLQTMQTIQAPGISKQQLENDRIRQMIQTGRYISPRDGRSNSVWNGQTMKEGQMLSPDQIKMLERQLQSGLLKVTDLIGNEVKQTGVAIDAYYNSLAKQNGMSLQEFKKGTSTWEEFSAKIRGYEEYKKWDREARAQFARQGGQGNVNFDKNNPYAEFRKWGVFRVDKMGENSYNELVGYMKHRDQLIAQIYGNMSQSYRAINRAEGITVKGIMGGGGGGKKSSATVDKEAERQAKMEAERQAKMLAELRKEEARAAKVIADERERARKAELKSHQTETTGTSGFNEQNIANWTSMMKDQLSKADFGSVMYNQIAESMKDMSSISQLAQVAMKNGLSPQALGLTDLFEQAFDNIDVSDASLQGVIGKINQKLQEKGIKPVKLDVDTGNLTTVNKVGKETAKTMQSAASAASSLSSAMSSIQDPAVRVAGMVAQAIGSVAMAYGQALATDWTSKSNIWTFIAAAAASTASMISTIAAIHSATGYAEGGIVKGNSYSGDNIIMPVNGGSGGYAGLNAGEIILNRASQGAIASQLTNGGGGMRVVGEIQGEKIVLVANRFLKRSGQGELVTW